MVGVVTGKIKEAISSDQNVCFMVFLLSRLSSGATKLKWNPRKYHVKQTSNVTFKMCNSFFFLETHTFSSYQHPYGAIRVRRMSAHRVCNRMIEPHCSFTADFLLKQGDRECIKANKTRTRDVEMFNRFTHANYRMSKKYEIRRQLSMMLHYRCVIEQRSTNSLFSNTKLVRPQ